MTVFATYADVPRLWPPSGQARNRFAALALKARLTGVKAIAWGDSRFTSPTGSGVDYFSSLQAMLVAQYGMLNASFAPCIGNYGGGTPGAAHGIFRAGGAGNGVAGDYDSAAYGFGAWRPHALTATAGQGWGLLVQPNQLDGPKDDGLGARPIWDTASEFTALLCLMTRPDCRAVTWEWRSVPSIPASAAGLYTLGTVRASGTIDRALLDAPIGTCVPVTLGPFGFHGEPYGLLVVRSTTAQGGTIGPPCYGALLESVEHKPGVCIIPCAEGGWKLSNHRLATGIGPLVQALAPDFGIIRVDVNNCFAGAGDTANTYRAELVLTMAHIRGLVGDPEFPIIVEHAHDRWDGTAGQRTQWALYAPRMASVCEEDGRAVLANTRRLMEFAAPATHEYDRWTLTNDAGEWSSASVAYALNARTTRFNRSFICTRAHTSTATNGPLSGGGTEVWREGYYYTAPLENVHPSPRGARVQAAQFAAMWNLLSTPDVEGTGPDPDDDASPNPETSMSSNIVARRIAVTAEWQRLSPASNVLTGTIFIPESNTSGVDIRFRDGDITQLVPGTEFELKRTDIHLIEARGTPGDVIQFAGGSWI